MILTLLFSAVLMQGQDRGIMPQRLKTVLPNGAIVLVEPAPKEANVNVMLFAAGRHVHEPKSGIRHLLEHLVVEGKDGNLDSRLETDGNFLHAQTTRDFVEISIACDPKKYRDGLEAVKEILQPRQWSAERIKQEVGVITQEAALEEDSSRLAAGAWTVAFGAAGADPIGDLAEMQTATPKEIESVRAQTFDPRGLVLVIEGPVLLGQATEEGKEILGSLKARSQGPLPEESRVPSAKSGRLVVEGFGEARGEVVPGFSSQGCAAGLAATLAIASAVPDSFVIYTPSTEPAVITVGNTTRRNLIGQKIDEMDGGEIDSLFERGRALAYHWLLKLTNSPYSDARLRGELLVQNPALRPEQLLTNIVGLTLAQFQTAMKGLSHDQALVAIGGR